MKKFLVGAIGALTVAGLAVGGVAIHNKIADKKITIKRGDSVWLGDKEQAPITTPTDEDMSAMDKYCQDNHCMMVNVAYIGDYVDSLLMTFSSKEEMLYGLVNNSVMFNIQGNMPEAEILGLATDTNGANLISQEEFETKLPELYEEKYVQLYVIVDNSPKATFSVNGQAIEASTNNYYFKTKADGTLNYPKDPDAPEGYIFAGWSPMYLDVKQIVDKTTYKPEGFVELHAVFVHSETGAPYDYNLTVNFHYNLNHTAPWQDGSGSDSIDCSDRATVDLGTTFDGLTLIGWSESPDDVENLRDNLIFHRDDNLNVYAVYQDSEGHKYSYSQVKGFDVVDPNTGEGFHYTVLASQLEDVKTALAELVAEKYALGISINGVDVIDISMLDFDSLQNNFLLVYDTVSPN